MIRQVPLNAKLTDEDVLAAIESAVPTQTVQAVIADLGIASRRQRKLPTELVLLLTVAMSLFTRQSLRQVLVKMLKGLRFVWPEPSFVVATKGAISQARYRLGARPVVELFRRVCQPLATTATRGAFLFDRRLVAIDLTFEDLPDSPENSRAFGHHWSDRGPSAFPQMMVAYLVECGTHAIFDLGCWRCHANQHAAAWRLLRSVKPGMLLLWDSGLHSFKMAAKTIARGADFLGRLPTGPKFTPIQPRLSDGTVLAYLYPDRHSRPEHRQRLEVRIITYTFTDPNRPGSGKTHRLMTSLLDAEAYSALDLICAYHERWEVELTIDELDTHQRLLGHPLRSQKLVGVIQELYGLAIAHHAIRRVMHDSALLQDVDPDRLSFVNAFELIADAIPEFQMAASQEHSVLYQRLLRDIAQHLLPERANRTNPRVVKRKMSKFNAKRPEHQHWPQPSKPFREAVAVLN